MHDNADSVKSDRIEAEVTLTLAELYGRVKVIGTIGRDGTAGAFLEALKIELDNLRADMYEQRQRDLLG